MALEVWIGQEFSTTHEQTAFNKIISELNDRFGGREEIVFLLANFQLKMVEIDLAILKRNSIIICELKECVDPFIATENGDWTTKDQSYVIGTNNQNPLQQARFYRSKWLEFFQSEFKYKINDMVSSYVCISPKINLESEINLHEGMAWFKLVGLDKLSEAVDNQRSNLTIGETEYRQIIKKLGLHVYKRSPLHGSFIVPFKQNSNYVGREFDLNVLHRKLSEEENQLPVVIRGLGGIGKTQLAVEYAYRFRGDYPQGVFWINAANDLIREFAQTAETLEIRLPVGDKQNRQRRLANVLLEKLKGCPDALLILDNVIDSSILHGQFLGKFAIDSLGCKILITARIFESHLDCLDLKTLSDTDAVNLFLKEANLINVVTESTDLFQTAINICQKVGNLPLALTLTASYLRKFPSITLDGFLQRLGSEGIADTIDSLENNSAQSISQILNFHWDSISLENSKKVLAVFTLFPDTLIVSAHRLKVLLGATNQPRPGYPHPIDQAIIELSENSLIEKVDQNVYRTHPIIKEYTKGKNKYSDLFEIQCAKNIIDFYNQPIQLELSVLDVGIREVIDDLTYCRSIYRNNNLDNETEINIVELIHTLSLEIHNFEIMDIFLSPNIVLQQLFNRASNLGYEQLSQKIYFSLGPVTSQIICRRFSTYSDFPLIKMILSGHTGSVTDVVLLKDGRTLLSASMDKTVRKWDLETGKSLEIYSIEFPIESIKLSPDENLAVLIEARYVHVESKGTKTISDSMIVFWDLASKKCLGRFSDSGEINGICEIIDQHRVANGTIDGIIEIRNFLNAEIIQKMVGHKGRITDITICKDKLASIDSSGEIIIWDLFDYSQLKKLKVIKTLYSQIQFSPNGKILAGRFMNSLSVGSLEEYFNDGDLFTAYFYVWNWETHSSYYFTDESYFKSDEDACNIIRELRRSDGWSIKRNFINPHPLIRFSENGSLILARGLDGNFLIHNLEGDFFKYYLNQGLYTFEFTRSNQVIIGIDGAPLYEDILFIENTDTEERLILHGHYGPINCLKTNPQNGDLISASDDSTIRIWEIEKQKGSDPQKFSRFLNVFKSKYHDEYLFSISNKKEIVYLNHSDQTWMSLTISSDEDIYFIEDTQEDQQALLVGERIFLYDFQKNTITEIFSSKGPEFPDRVIACVEETRGNYYGLIEKYPSLLIEITAEPQDIDNFSINHINDDKVLYSFHAKSANIFYNKNGCLLVKVLEENKVVVSDLSTNNEFIAFDISTSSDEYFYVGDDGVELLFIRGDGELSKWDIRTGENIVRKKINKIIDASFEASGNIIALTHEDRITILDLKRKMTAILPGQFKKGMISQNGKSLFTLDQNGVLDIYDCLNI